LCCRLPLFSSVRGLEFLLFGRVSGTLLQSQWGVLGLCLLWEAGLLEPAEQHTATQCRGWDSGSLMGEIGLSYTEV
jgi:hypothetical protein